MICPIITCLNFILIDLLVVEIFHSMKCALVHYYKGDPLEFGGGHRWSLVAATQLNFDWGPR
jgi:hypothetical protein